MNESFIFLFSKILLLWETTWMIGQKHNEFFPSLECIVTVINWFINMLVCWQIRTVDVLRCTTLRRIVLLKCKMNQVNGSYNWALFTFLWYFQFFLIDSLVSFVLCMLYIASYWGEPNKNWGARSWQCSCLGCCVEVPRSQ